MTAPHVLLKVLHVSALLAAPVLLLGMLAAFTYGLGLPGLLWFLALCAGYGWMLFAFFHYRFGRQEELLYILATAAEGGVPLAPALWAYLRDRPRGVGREFWVAVLLFFVLPGYYWVWHRQHSYDRKVARVAALLESGYSLHQALSLVGGVASPEGILAAAVGQSTGRLAPCLRSAARGRVGPAWLEVVPRLLYPLVLLVLIVGVVGFWLRFVMPRFSRIFQEFGVAIPRLTAWLLDLEDVVDDYGWVVPLVAQAVVCLGVLLYVSPDALWYFPGVGRLYRMGVQSRVLKMLAALLEVGRPVPEALALLTDAGAFPWVVRRRLRGTRAAVERGEPLANSLRRYKLLPRAMVPLLEAAGRARNVPWALTEMGEHLAARAVRLLQRFSLALSPATVAVLGLVVGLLVVAMFVPLVAVITELAE